MQCLTLFLVELLFYFIFRVGGYKVSVDTTPSV